MKTHRTIKFEYDKFQKKMASIFSILLSFLGAATVLMVATCISFYFGKNVSSHPFEFHSLSDLVLVLLWIFSSVLPLALFIKNQKKSSLLTIAFFFTEGIWVSTLIGLLLNPKGHLTKEVVRKMLHATQVTYVVSSVIMLIFAVLTIWCLVKRLKKNNWLLFLIMAPYIVFSWDVERSYEGFHKMLKMDDFSVSFLYRMLVKFNGNVDLINEMVFRLMAITIAGLFVILGILIYETIYQKTKKWRKA